MMGKASRGRPSDAAAPVSAIASAIPSPSLPAILLSMMLVTLPVPAAAMLRCNELQVDGHMFNLSPLAGPHAVVTSEHSPPSWFNTSYTVDVCAFLKRKGDVKKEWECPGKSRACAIKHTWDPDTKKLEERPVEVIPLAGDLTKDGQGFEYGLTRLSTSSAQGDQGKEGIRVEMKGGLYKEREQRAVIEFRCNRSMTGLEGEWSSDDQYVPGDPETAGARRRSPAGPAEGQDDSSGGDEGTQEKQLRKEDAALVWDSYGPSADGKMDVVSLTWQTKYACESGRDEGGRDSESKHWGLFTWLFIVAFMATAAYLIFGSWLNYNRYGARGWDLLPHGDAIRDVPYLFKDWTRRVLNTVQSSGSRGGYSAV